MNTQTGDNITIHKNGATQKYKIKDVNRSYSSEIRKYSKIKRRCTFGASILILSLLHSLASSMYHVTAAKSPLTLNIPQKHSSNENSTNTNTNTILEVYENESYDSKLSTWYGAENRWTTSSGSVSDPPTSLLPPKQFHFSSDWKIDVSGTGTRDKEGWEYFTGGRRRRRWLRILAPIPVSENSKSNRSLKPSKRGRATSTMKGQSPTRQLSLNPKSFSLSILSPLIQDYNFKGFGLSLYKSLLSPSSFGAIFRLPLTTNFDFCETRPHIPSITTSTGFFGSHNNFTIAAYLSLSMPMEVIRYCFLKMIKFIYLLYWLIWEKIIKGSLLLLQSLFLSKSSDKNDKKVTSTLKTVSSILSSSSIQYSRNYQERVSCSVSWRYSTKKGYEFRISYAHSYLPTMDYLFLRNKNGQLSNWFREKTGSWGISSSFPIPDSPGFSVSNVLGLSGFYPHKMRFFNKMKNENNMDLENDENINTDRLLEGEENSSNIAEKKHITTAVVTRDEKLDTNKIINGNDEKNGDIEGTDERESEDEKKKLISSSFGLGSGGR